MPAERRGGVRFVAAAGRRRNGWQLSIGLKRQGFFFGANFNRLGGARSLERFCSGPAEAPPPSLNRFVSYKRELVVRRLAEVAVSICNEACNRDPTYIRTNQQHHMGRRGKVAAHQTAIGFAQGETVPGVAAKISDGIASLLLAGLPALVRSLKGGLVVVRQHVGWSLAVLAGDSFEVIDINGRVFDTPDQQTADFGAAAWNRAKTGHCLCTKAVHGVQRKIDNGRSAWRFPPAIARRGRRRRGLWYRQWIHMR